jgi:hypothetical protein
MLQLRLMQARRELVRRADHLGRRFCRGGGAVIGWVQAKQITSAASSATTPGSRMPHFSQIAEMSRSLLNYVGPTLPGMNVTRPS